MSWGYTSRGATSCLCLYCGVYSYGGYKVGWLAKNWELKLFLGTRDHACCRGIATHYSIVLSFSEIQTVQGKEVQQPFQTWHTRTQDSGYSVLLCSDDSVCSFSIHIDSEECRAVRETADTLLYL